MTARHGPQLAAAIAGRSPDIGSRRTQLRTATAVRPVTVGDVDDTDTPGAGNPYPGWWVLLDDTEISVPVAAGAAAIEPGCPLWLAHVGGGWVALAGVTTGHTAGELPTTPSPAHPWVHLTRATTQSIPNFTNTAVTWTGDGTEGAPWDAVSRGGTGSWWSSGSDATVPISGLWAVTAAGTWAAHATGWRSITVERDHGGATTRFSAQSAMSIGAALPLSQATHAIVNAAQGDKLRVLVAHAAGAALTLNSAAMTLAYIGPGT